MRRLVPLLSLALVAAVAPAAAQPSGAQPDRPLFSKSIREQWNEPVKPFRVVGNIYYVGTKELGVYLITTPKGHILTDGGFEETAPVIARNVAALGFKISDVKVLLNSHAHFDHAGGLAALKRRTGALLYASAADRPALEAGRIDFGPSAATPFEKVKVDRLVRDGQTVSLGGAVLTAHLTPGHTRGCTTWTLPVVENGVRHTAVFYCSTSVAGNPLVGNTAYPQIAADYRSSFARLRGLKADVLLANHPGFADIFQKRDRVRPGKPNPFVDPRELQIYVATSSAAFEKELASQKAKQEATR